MFAGLSGTPQIAMNPSVAIMPIASGSRATSMCLTLPKSSSRTRIIAIRAYTAAHKNPLRIAAFISAATTAINTYESVFGTGGPAQVQLTELVDLLRELGHIATQSSVSRDLRELGVAKMGDRYVLPESGNQPRSDFSALKQFVNARLTAGTNLTVLKTTIGSAQSVAVAIDTAQWPEVVGTISGDDTIFIATSGAEAQRKLGDRLLALFGR